MATLEQQVEDEQETYEDEQAKAPDDEQPEDDEELTPPEDPEGKALFDKAAYETEALALPKIDGEGVDKIAVKFAGTVWLERGDEADVALLKNTRLGQKVMLAVEAEVGPPVPSLTTNRDGDLDVISLSRKFTVVNVHRAVGEGLEAA